MIVALAPLLGHWISDRVPSELPIGERWFLLATALFCFGMLTVFPWYLALIVTGLILLSPYTALLGLAPLAHADSLLAAQLACVLGMLVGTRWRIERKPVPLLIAGAAFLAATAVVGKLI
jgi:hypothetical protein